MEAKLRQMTRKQWKVFLLNSHLDVLVLPGEDESFASSILESKQRMWKEEGLWERRKWWQQKPVSILYKNEAGLGLKCQDKLGSKGYLWHTCRNATSAFDGVKATKQRASVSNEMLAKVNVDKTPVKISTHWNVSINKRLVVQIPTAMYRGTAKAPTIRSAMAKLISRKCGRFRSFCFKNITVVIRFPMVITTDVKANVSVQKMFQCLVKSMTNLKHKICQYCNLPAKKKQIGLFK